MKNFFMSYLLRLLYAISMKSVNINKTKKPALARL